MSPYSDSNSPGKTGQPYEYIPGQTTAMPRANVLVYEAKAVHRGGKCLVLRVNGTVELLLLEKLNEAVAQTKRRLGQ